MKTDSIYQRAAKKGCYLECACKDIDTNKWNELMKGHRPANRTKVLKVALQAKIINQHSYKMERKIPYWNPYKHFITKTHVIYVNSAIEYFIKINT